MAASAKRAVSGIAFLAKVWMRTEAYATAAAAAAASFKTISNIPV